MRPIAGGTSVTLTDSSPIGARTGRKSGLRRLLARLTDHTEAPLACLRGLGERFGANEPPTVVRAR